MSVSKADRERWRKAEEVERSLARKIRIWAETWKRCPKKGCRRAGKCIRFDACAGVPKEPSELPEEFKRAFRDALDQERARRGLPPRLGYDPDAREREAPMPPAPKRTAPPSRPSPKGESRDPEP